jgi:hypothetical protein
MRIEQTIKRSNGDTVKLICIGFLSVFCDGIQFDTFAAVKHHGSNELKYYHKTRGLKSLSSKEWLKIKGLHSVVTIGERLKIQKEVANLLAR